MDRNLARHLPLPIVKSLFNVSTAYVGAKLRLICFPWTHKRWMRVRNETIAPDGAPITAGYLSPRQDVNSPDLYIPFMSVVTYIILAATYAGIHNRFHPEVLGGRASVSFAVALTELAIIKLICYLLGVETGASAETGWSAGVSGSVELMSYCGYKFVSVLPPLAVKLFFPSWRFVYYAVFFYCLAAQGFFLVCISLAMWLSSHFTAQESEIRSPPRCLVSIGRHVSFCRLLRTPTQTPVFVHHRLLPARMDGCSCMDLEIQYCNLKNNYN